MTITPDEDGTFSYSTTQFCTGGADPTPTISGTTGGSFSSGSGLSIDASTGVIDLSASTAGSYTVSYLTQVIYVLLRVHTTFLLLLMKVL